MISSGKKLPDVFADGTVAGESTLRQAIAYFLLKLCVVLFEQLQECLLLYPDSEIGVFQLGGGNIAVRLHQLLITAVYVRADTVDGAVDFPRLRALSLRSVVLHIPQAERNVHFAAELFSLAVHRDAAHQRQVSVGFLAALLHVK